VPNEPLPCGAFKLASQTPAEIAETELERLWSEGEQCHNKGLQTQLSIKDLFAKAHQESHPDHHMFNWLSTGTEKKRGKVVANPSSMSHKKTERELKLATTNELAHTELKLGLRYFSEEAVHSMPHAEQSSWDMLREMGVNEDGHKKDLAPCSSGRMKIKLTKDQLAHLLHKYLESSMYNREYDQVSVIEEHEKGQEFEELHVKLHTIHGPFRFTSGRRMGAITQDNLLEWGAALRAAMNAIHICTIREKAHERKHAQKEKHKQDKMMLHSLEKTFQGALAKRTDVDKQRFAMQARKTARSKRLQEDLTWRDGDEFKQKACKPDGIVEVTVYEYQRLERDELVHNRHLNQGTWVFPEYPRHRWSDLDCKVRYSSHRHDTPVVESTSGYVWCSPWMVGSHREGKEKADVSTAKKWTAWEYAFLLSELESVEKEHLEEAHEEDEKWIPIKTEDNGFHNERVSTIQYHGRFLRRRAWHRSMKPREPVKQRVKPQRARCKNSCKLS